MKILYLIDNKIDKKTVDGVGQKVFDKVQCWKNNGHEVDILSLYSVSFFDPDLNERKNIFSININKHGRWVTLFRLFYSTLVINFLLYNKEYDLVYMRYRPWMPFFCAFMKKNKVVIELNTNDYEEYRNMSKWMFYYNKLTRNWIYKRAKALVSVSHELKNDYAHFNKPTKVIGNGIDVKKFEHKNNFTNVKPQLAFIASKGYPWHGVEKVYLMARKFQEFEFHMIGFQDKDILLDNLHFHGYLNIENSKKILSGCDVGIGTLSLHVNKMNEASPLKTRQYFAQGLPVIYAYDDTDLQENVDFVLKLPNTPDNVENHLDKIKKFIEFAHNNRELSIKAREFALKRLDVEAKEIERLEFLKSV